MYKPCYCGILFYDAPINLLLKMSSNKFGLGNCISGGFSSAPASQQIWVNFVDICHNEIHAHA